MCQAVLHPKTAIELAVILWRQIRIRLIRLQFRRIVGLNFGLKRSGPCHSVVAPPKRSASQIDFSPESWMLVFFCTHRSVSQLVSAVKQADRRLLSLPGRIVDAGQARPGGPADHQTAAPPRPIDRNGVRNRSLAEDVALVGRRKLRLRRPLDGTLCWFRAAHLFAPSDDGDEGSCLLISGVIIEK